MEPLASNNRKPIEKETAIMKAFAMILLLFLAVILLGAPSGADPISVTIAPPDVVFFVVAKGVSEWADNPVGTCTGTSDNQCCTGSVMDALCKDTAISIRTAPEHWVRRIFSCLTDNPNWKCDLFITTQRSAGMYCETVPAEDVVLADVATCLSAESLLEANPQ